MSIFKLFVQRRQIEGSNGFAQRFLIRPRNVGRLRNLFWRVSHWGQSVKASGLLGQIPLTQKLKLCPQFFKERFPILICKWQYQFKCPRANYRSQNLRRHYCTRTSSQTQLKESLDGLYFEKSTQDIFYKLFVLTSTVHLETNRCVTTLKFIDQKWIYDEKSWEFDVTNHCSHKF